jgi:hypothetical protein
MDGNAFLYIDPGTGSMLFSIVMGLVAAAYFMLKAAWIKIKFFFTGKLRGASAAPRKHGIVIYSEGNQYWNVFSPILDEFERRGVPVTYFTSSTGDPALTREWRVVTPEFIGEGNKAFAKLNFLEANVCLMTTPGLDVYQLKRSRGVSHYAHVLHDVGDATCYRLFSLDYFDSVILSGEYQKKAIRELEAKRNLHEKELFVAGSTYLDMLGSRLSSTKRDKAASFTVLVSPSWGPSALLSRYGEKLLDPLVETGLHVIVRPHPQSKKSESATLSQLERRYEGRSNLEWDYSSENIATLARSDVMISDFSGIIFDYAFLFDRPFFYAAADYDDEIYDSSDLEEKPWKFKAIAEMGIELSASMFPDIGNLVKSAATNPVLSDRRKAARETAWQHRGDSAARIADFLTEKQRELSC